MFWPTLEKLLNTEQFFGWLDHLETIEELHVLLVLLEALNEGDLMNVILMFLDLTNICYWIVFCGWKFN
jgi:hypothetical protein